MLEPSSRSTASTQPTTRVFNEDNPGPSRVLSTDARPVSAFCAAQVPKDRRPAYSRLQKGGDPAAGSPTATLLRLRPSHRARLRPLRPSEEGSVTDFGRSRLPWRDGRCVQGPGTYSPWCS